MRARGRAARSAWKIGRACTTSPRCDSRTRRIRSGTDTWTRGCGGQSVAMIRRISTKLLLAVLAAVVLPFVGFALFVDTTMAERLSRDVVLFSLKSLAADLAGRIDRQIEQFRGDVRFLARLDL